MAALMMRVDSMEVLSEIAEQELPPTSVSSNLAPRFETNIQQHTTILATPVEPVLDNNLEIPAEDTSKISAESPPHNELPGLVEESENQPHEVLPQDTLVFAADVVNKESLQLEKEADLTQTAGSLLQQEDITKPDEQVDECLTKKQSDAVDLGLDTSAKIGNATQGVMMGNNDAVQQILIEDVDSMQEVATQSEEMTTKGLELNDDNSASEKEHEKPTNESPDKNTVTLFKSSDLKSLSQDAVKESNSIVDDVTQKLLSKDNPSVSSVISHRRSISLPQWSAPIPAIRSPSAPPNHRSLQIPPLSPRAKSSVRSFAPIPPTPSHIPEHLSILIRRSPSPARDSSPVRPPSSTRDPSPITDLLPLKDTSPTRAAPTPRQASPRIITDRQIPAVVITVPPPTQKFTPLPTEYPSTEVTTPTTSSVPRIKIKFNESPQSSESPPPAKRQKVSRSKTKGILDCIVVRSDFENVLPAMIGSNM